MQAGELVGLLVGSVAGRLRAFVRARAGAAAEERARLGGWVRWGAWVGGCGAVANFGQTKFGKPKPSLAQTKFDQDQVWPDQLACALEVHRIVAFSAPSKRPRPPRPGPLRSHTDHPSSAGPPSAGPPKISLFFPSPATIFILSSLSWGSSRGILVVF